MSMNSQKRSPNRPTVPFSFKSSILKWNIMLHILNTYLSLRDNKLDNFFVRTSMCMSKGSTTLKCNLREKKCHHLKSFKPSFFKSSKETKLRLKSSKLFSWPNLNIKNVIFIYLLHESWTYRNEHLKYLSHYWKIERYFAHHGSNIYLYTNFQCCYIFTSFDMYAKPFHWFLNLIIW